MKLTGLIGLIAFVAWCWLVSDEPDPARGELRSWAMPPLAEPAAVVPPARTAPSERACCEDDPSATAGDGALEASRRIFGVVQDDAGVAIAGAWVWLAVHPDATPLHSARSDASGRFEIVAGSRGGHLIVTAPGYAAQHEVVPAVGVEIRRDLELTPIPTLDVIAMLRDQERTERVIPSAVRINTVTDDWVGDDLGPLALALHGRALDLLVDANRRVRVPLPDPGTYQVQVMFDDYLPALGAPIAVMNTHSRVECEVWLEADQGVRGIVLAPDGQTPVADAEVTVELIPPPRMLRVDLFHGVETFGHGRPLATARTDADGRFRIRGALPPADLRIRATQHSIGTAWQPLVAGRSSPECAIRLERFGEVTGRLIGEFAPDLRVIAQTRSGSVVVVGIDAAGNYRMTVPAGHLHIDIGRARAPEHSRDLYGGDRMPTTPPVPAYDLAVGEAQAVRHDIHLDREPYSWVEVTVRTDGVALPAARITLESLDGATDMFATSDASGMAFLGRAPRGTYSVAAYPAGGSAAIVRRTVDLGRFDEPITLESARCSLGVSVQAEVAPIPPVSLELRRRDATGVWRRAGAVCLRDDLRGEFDWLPPGEYRVRASDEQGQSGEALITVIGTQTDAVVTLR